jgi:hypothetical protein
MSRAVVGDCRVCGAAGSVQRGYCQVCYADDEESGAADLPPAAPGPPGSYPHSIAQPNRPVT